MLTSPLATNPAQPVSSERLRQITYRVTYRITWPIWLPWVLVCALVPICNTTFATAFGKQIAPNAEYRALIMTGLLALSAFAILAPPIIQALVLKRVVPKLSIWVWFVCILLAGIAWLALMFGRHGQGPALIEAGFQTQVLLQRAALAERRLAGTLNAADILVLPWAPFLLWTIATSALTSLIPAGALGVASRRWRAALLFLGAAIVGACASAVVEQIYGMIVNDRILGDWALNGRSWTDRFQIVAARSGAGAVWGATTAMFVILMTRRFADAKAPNAWVFATQRTGGLAFV